MPNWCYNQIYITGASDNIDRILDILQKDGVDEINIMDLRPMPDILRDTKSPVPRNREEDPEAWDKALAAQIVTGYNNWYDWAVANWGTKWDAPSNYYHIHNDNLFSLAVDTAWSPPVALLSYIAKQYEVIVSSTFSEEGMDYCGVFIGRPKHEDIDITEDIPNFPGLGEPDWNDDRLVDEYYTNKYRMLRQYLKTRLTNELSELV